MLGATLAVAALSAIPGCTTAVTGTAVRSAGATDTKSAACNHVSAELTTIDVHTAGEPQLRIPQPPGWRRNTMLDSELIRYAMDASGLTANRFAPTAVVTLESGPGTTGDQHEIFDQERTGLVDALGATDVHTTDTTLCGHHAVILRYTLPAMGRIPPRKAQTLITAGTFSGTTYAATLTVQSRQPDNETYVHDSPTILVSDVGTRRRLNPAGPGPSG